MTTKQKVLKILDKYRDMSLTMGCEVEYETDAGIKMVHVIVTEAEHNTEYEEEESLVYKYDENDHKNSNYAICHLRSHLNKEYISERVLGHPATPLTLLKALGNMKGALTVDAKVDNNGWEQAYFSVVLEIDKDTCQSYGFFVPLVSTLSETPESDPLWQAVLDVLI